MIACDPSRIKAPALRARVLVNLRRFSSSASLSATIGEKESPKKGKWENRSKPSSEAVGAASASGAGGQPVHHYHTPQPTSYVYLLYSCSISLSNSASFFLNCIFAAVDYRPLCSRRAGCPILLMTTRARQAKTTSKPHEPPELTSYAPPEWRRPWSRTADLG